MPLPPTPPPPAEGRTAAGGWGCTRTAPPRGHPRVRATALFAIVPSTATTTIVAAAPAMNTHFFVASICSTASSNTRSRSPLARYTAAAVRGVIPISVPNT